MVILLSALAVVAAAILLVAWFVVGGGFTLIYAAMALAVVSMVLLWAARWLGSSPAPAGSLAPAPLAEEIRVEVPIRDEVDEEAAVRRPFPIADYEHLWVTQILPLLPELDDGELAVVEARERGARHRGGILDAIDDVRRGRSVAAVPGGEVPDVDDPADPDAELDPSAAADDDARAPLAAGDPPSDVEPLATAARHDDDDVDVDVDDEAEAEAFERAWSQLTAIDDLDDLDDRPRRRLGRSGADLDLDLTDGPGAAPAVPVEPSGDALELAVASDPDEPAPESPGAAGAPPAGDVGGGRPRDLVGSRPGAPRVRTFLGRVSGPITLDRGAEDGLP